MERIIDQIHKALIKKKKKLAIAESCTGGLLSSILTHLSGSSKYFIVGVIAYNNKVKESILKVPAGLIRRKGAVCAEVAAKMAQSARKLAKADFGLGITGIAGPTGGSQRKPVGTVFIALDSKITGICKEFRFSGSRTSIRKKAALKSLELLKAFL